MRPLSEGEERRLDAAARAGWLYYVARRTQDDIARELGVSRQKVQRLVSLATTAGLVKVRLDHPIARCMELAAALRGRWGLGVCEVAPSTDGAPGLLAGVAAAAAAELERVLAAEEPRIVALGTGRALTATVDQVERARRPQHRIVSLAGNMMADGSASPFAATARLAERTGARHYPMALPVLAASRDELAVLHAQAPVRATLRLCARAHAAFVGVGWIGPDAPLAEDGFVAPADIEALRAAGAVGEITGWCFDAGGRLLPGGLNDRVAGAPLEPDPPRPVVAVAMGAAKVAAIRAALEGRFVNGLVTDERTAEALLAGRRAAPGA